MPIEKSPYRAPQGMPDGDEPLDVEIADDQPYADNKNVTDNGDGTLTVNLGPEEPEPLGEIEHDANLALHLPDDYLTTLGSDLCEDIENDERSREDWEKTYKEGLKLLGLRIEERNDPWKGACGVVHPLLAEAVVRFQAELVTETFPPHGPVKTKILGMPDKNKEDAAERVREDMNIELTDRMTEYRPEHERLLWNLPIAGSALKKVYFDPSLGRQTAMFVSAEDFIVAYGCSDLQTATRYTHRFKKTENELKKLVVSGFYRDVDLGEPTASTEQIGEQKDKLAGRTPPPEVEHYTLYECCVDMTIQGLEDPLGIDLPYIITLDKQTKKVLAIRRNYDPDSPTRAKKQHFVHYQYIPGFGFYGFGLIHLVGGFAEGATSLLRQLVDAGTLANLPGGLKTRGLRIKGDDTPIGPGEWRDVDVPGGTLKENLLPLPYKEPSAVLESLLNTIVEEGRKFAAVAEMKVADFDSNSPVGTTMALLERTLKVMTAVQARIYDAMKLEFRIIKNLIRDHGKPQYEYVPASGDASTRHQDYAAVDLLPVADPNAATMSQRIVQWQAVMQLAAGAPQIYDQPQLHGEMLGILGVKNVDRLIPQLKGVQDPMDPVSENMAIMTGKPVKAFITQDHMSHITVHQSAMQDPMLQQMLGQNPQAPMIMAAAQAHLMEHLAFEYRKRMEQNLGVPLPPPDQPLPPDVETQLASLLAQAAPKLLAQNQQQAQQQQAAQAAQDPVLAAQMADTEVKRQEVERKKAKDAADAALKARDLDIKEKKVDQDGAAKGMEIGSHTALERERMQHEAQKHERQVGSQEHQTSFKAAVDMTKQERDHAHQQTTQQQQHAHDSAQQAQQQVHEDVKGAADRAHQSEQADKAAQAKASEKPKGGDK